MQCDNDSCLGENIASVYSKCNDLANVSIGNIEKDGYLPDDLGIGGGDTIEFSYCLDCGKIQGEFPVRPHLLLDFYRIRSMTAKGSDVFYGDGTEDPIEIKPEDPEMLNQLLKDFD